MISVCTVVDKLQRPCFESFLHTLARFSSGLVTNLYVACIDDGGGTMDCSEDYDGVRVNYFNVTVPPRPCWISYKHSIGLHKCLERVQTPYTMMSDCDLLFECPGYDRFYIDLLEENNLNIAGIEMYRATWHGSINAYGDFPCIHNCLVRTAELPPPEMFRGMLRYGCGADAPIEENYYLVLGCIPQYRHLYPRPDGHYDTGCNLHLWCHLINGLWLTFFPGWGRVGFRHRSNAGKIVLPKHTTRTLLYHHGGLFDGRSSNEFFQEYHRLRSHPELGKILEPR